MDPLSAAGLGVEAIKWIRNVASKKIIITPDKLTVTTKHWDSTASIIVQNMTEKPLFGIQIVCWLNEKQEMEFTPHHMKKLLPVGNLSVDTALFIVPGSLLNGKSLYLLELNQLFAKQSIEIDLQIRGRGEIKFEAVHYETKGGRLVLKDKDQISIPFSPPFKMEMHGINLWIGKNEK